MPTYMLTRWRSNDDNIEGLAQATLGSNVCLSRLPSITNFHAPLLNHISRKLQVHSQLHST